MMRSLSRRPRRGAAAVEAAVVFPILLAFFAASYQLGRLGKIADSVSTAARNGAQYGSINSMTAAKQSDIRAAAVTEMVGLPNVSSTNPTVTATSVTHSNTNFLRVQVTYDMTGTSIFPMFGVNSMSRTVEMPMMPQ